MKVFFRGLLVVILVAFLAGSVYAEPTVKDLQGQLEKLMKQVDDQKKQIETLQKKNRRGTDKAGPAGCSGRCTGRNKGKLKVQDQYLWETQIRRHL